MVTLAAMSKIGSIVLGLAPWQTVIIAAGPVTVALHSAFMVVLEGCICRGTWFLFCCLCELWSYRSSCIVVSGVPEVGGMRVFTFLMKNVVNENFCFT